MKYTCPKCNSHSVMRGTRCANQIMTTWLYCCNCQYQSPILDTVNTTAMEKQIKEWKGEEN